ncbi:DUF5134 domain-containing protein [Nocardia sp. NPDC050713]|uniref:DUF5134 domain-containing protein n=1 Tax=Nocardia sp. NPDC050713 TaxID=3154511 RepID=UPI0033FC14DD
MAEFVQEYAALRWSVVAAFLVASAIVTLRLAGPVRGNAGSVDEGIGGARILESPAGSNRVASQRISSHPQAAHQESDAAHLVMCLIMLAMLLFPTGASPHAVRGVLIAMTVAFGALLVGRIVEWRATRENASAGQIFAIGYHAFAAAAMLYAMSGHSAAGHAGPPPVAASALAALFLADALAVLFLRGGGWHRIAHSVGAIRSAAVVPHVVMDLGMAYMLVAAALG